MILRLVRKLFSAETLGFVLVLVALQTLTYGVSVSLRGTETKYLFPVCLTAVLISVGLNKAKWGGVPAAIVMTLIGVTGLWVLGARLLPPLTGLLRSIAALAPQVVPAIHERTAIDTALVGNAWTVLAQASAVLAGRWQIWLARVGNKDAAVSDTLIRSMIWTLIMWLIAAWTGWFAARRNAVLALLPHLTLLAFVISYSERKAETLWLVVFILLLLMGLWNYKNHLVHWEQRSVDYSDSIRYDNTQAVLLLAVCVGMVAFLTPSITLRQIREFLRQHNDTNRTAQVLGIQEQPVKPKTPFALKSSLPREHLLTEGFEQSQQIVMNIRTGELPPIPDVSNTMEVPRYYWRSTVYDGYTGAGWATSAAPPQNLKANTPLVSGLLEGYRPLHLDVEIVRPEGRLFWSGILYSADVPFRADWRVRPQSDLFGDQTTLLQADMFAAVTSAAAYTAESYVPVVSVQRLRSASSDYPDEIRNRYLYLPGGVPERVHQLARQIVRGVDNPYDKAKAIETYLRTYYPYDLKVPTPPAGHDVADYFLFELRRGYCDYYATAMVVLARENGLPARFVSGYSSGAYDAPNARYVVRELNAHSWAEVYFPQIGWIEFEPTGSEPEIERPEKDPQLATPVKPITPASRLLFQFTHGIFLYWLVALGIGVILVILYYAFFERIVFTSIAPVTAITFLYRRYYRMGRPLVGARAHAETASEFTNALIDKVKETRRDATRRKPMRAFEADVKRLTGIYHATLFSDHTLGKNESRTALQTWKRLRRFLFIEKIRILILNKTAPVLNRIKR